MVKRLTVLLMFLSLFLNGCGNRYSYYSFKSQAEKALKEKKLQRAHDLYATIYQNEKKATTKEPEHLLWSFYRLGVINELLGDVNMAMGYYWGDSIEEGFYAADRQIEWFAASGLEWLDEGKPSRTLEQILELESQRRPSKIKTVSRPKKEIKIEPRQASPQAQKEVLPSNRPTRVFNRSLTPPSPSAPEPFRIYY